MPSDRIVVLEALARERVGDGQLPNLFFVSTYGNIQMVTLDEHAARAYWLTLPREADPILEDRLNGILADYPQPGELS